MKCIKYIFTLNIVYYSVTVMLRLKLNWDFLIDMQFHIILLIQLYSILYDEICEWFALLFKGGTTENHTCDILFIIVLFNSVAVFLKPCIYKLRNGGKKEME